MSWQTYVDSNLIGTKKISSAVIVGLDGNTWAASKNFAVPPAEAKAIVGHFANPSKMQAEGLKIAGKKYMPVRYDDRSIYGKLGTGGACCVKTKQAVLIALYDSGQPGEVNTIVEKLGDYLISVNY